MRPEGSLKDELERVSQHDLAKWNKRCAAAVIEERTNGTTSTWPITVYALTMLKKDSPCTQLNKTWQNFSSGVADIRRSSKVRPRRTTRSANILVFTMLGHADSKSLAHEKRWKQRSTDDPKSFLPQHRNTSCTELMGHEKVVMGTQSLS